MLSNRLSEKPSAHQWVTNLKYDVWPVQDVSGDDAMGGTEPGAELGEEDVGADCQQQSLLLNETITAPIKNTVKRRGSVPVCRVNEKTIQGYACFCQTQSSLFCTREKESGTISG